MKYYYTIGEVSNLIDVKPYVIRYWETEFVQLRPRKGKGRIRKYTEEQIQLLKKIKYMLYEQRFTIEGARQKLKHEMPDTDQLEIEIWQNPDVPKTISEELVTAALDLRNSLCRIKDRIEIYRRSNI